MVIGIIGRYPHQIHSEYEKYEKKEFFSLKFNIGKREKEYHQNGDAKNAQKLARRVTSSPP